MSQVDQPIYLEGPQREFYPESAVGLMMMWNEYVQQSYEQDIECKLICDGELAIPGLFHQNELSIYQCLQLQAPYHNTNEAIQASHLLEKVKYAITNDISLSVPFVINQGVVQAALVDNDKLHKCLPNTLVNEPYLTTRELSMLSEYVTIVLNKYTFQI